MNPDAAAAIALERLDAYRARTYEQLKELLVGREPFEGETDDGTHYYGVVYALWDDRENGNLRVWADVSWSARSHVSPVTRTFIRAPDGTFVGE